MECLGLERLSVSEALVRQVGSQWLNHLSDSVSTFSGNELRRPWTLSVWAPWHVGFGLECIGEPIGMSFWCHFSAVGQPVSEQPVMSTACLTNSLFQLDLATDSLWNSGTVEQYVVPNT